MTLIDGNYPMTEVAELLAKVMGVADTQSAEMVITTGDGLELSLTLSRTIYRVCRYCGQQIYDDSAKGADAAWVTKDDEDDECPRNNYAHHEPKEYTSATSVNDQ